MEPQANGAHILILGPTLQYLKNIETSVPFMISKLADLLGYRNPCGTPDIQIATELRKCDDGLIEAIIKNLDSIRPDNLKVTAFEAIADAIGRSCGPAEPFRITDLDGRYAPLEWNIGRHATIIPFAARSIGMQPAHAFA